MASQGVQLSTAALERLHSTRAAAATELLARRNAAGHWEGRLSSSALSTATAVIALQQGGARDTGQDQRLVELGNHWLVAHQNDDGGWGDTTDSPSNMSTTLLAWVALGLGAPDAPDAPRPEVSPAWGAALAHCETWLSDLAGDLTPENLSRAVASIYGNDKTFAVPIQVTCALGGRFGAGAQAWRAIPALPFELAALPARFFSRVGLPMVSYAMPALIAIGIVIEQRKRNWNPFTRIPRALTRARCLRTLEAIQPSSGGFLEATPLTSFVCISLIGAGRGAHPVVSRGLEFLRASARADGSWPIDTNLATWVTSLSVDALGAGRELDPSGAVTNWLAGQQYLAVHPYTHAAPGGWAWTDLPGGVPDADDTPAALLALANLGALGGERATLGARWLMGLQNRDGGIPTFCRGWGKLPFDRSCPDLTAHALRAFAVCERVLAEDAQGELVRSRERAARYLIESQRADGAWVPLWFGNQQEAQLENPLYGTSRVVKAFGAVEGPAWRAAVARGVRWMLAAQGRDGGFGGAPGLRPSLEETGLALDGLASVLLAKCEPLEPALLEDVRVALAQGAHWLAGTTDGGRRFEATPIGLYFAKLWYSEELYPLIFTVAGLERTARALAF